MTTWDEIVAALHARYPDVEACFYRTAAVRVEENQHRYGEVTAIDRRILGHDALAGVPAGEAMTLIDRTLLEIRWRNAARGVRAR